MCFRRPSPLIFPADKLIPLGIECSVNTAPMHCHGK
jgi:hypothetical protein